MALLELEKLRKDINILFGYVRCLMAKSDETSPLVATEWSSNHSTTTGNPYTIGTHVFYNGHVYKCLFNNDGIIPTNTTYWLDLGEGHLLAEEQSDWNATGGRRFILNKPDLDNKIIYFYPTLIELGVSTLEEVTETHIATWIQNQGIVIADDEIPLFKIKVTLYPIQFYEVGLVNENVFPNSPQAPPMKTFYTDQLSLNGVSAEEGATIFLTKDGTTKFEGDLLGLNYIWNWVSINDKCLYNIDPQGIVTTSVCHRS